MTGALTEEEIRASFEGLPGFVSEARVMASMTQDERKALNDARRQRQEYRLQIKQRGPTPGNPDSAAWFDLVMAMLNARETIYLR